MRNVILGYQSALEYLCRKRYFGASFVANRFHLEDDADVPRERTCRIRSLRSVCPSDNHVGLLLDSRLRGISAPLHVLVPNASDCSRSRLKIAHVWSSPPLRGSFAKIAPGLLTCSAELCLVQFARLFPPVELARLACELCGAYALAPERENGFCTCAPATSIEFVRAFARRARENGTRGAEALLTALDFAVDGAASPMESAIALLLCLPYRYGGYHLPLPTLNERPVKTGGRRSIADATTHRCDLLWPDANVALEYEATTGTKDRKVPSGTRHATTPWPPRGTLCLR